MAEFQKVIRERNRICKTNKCSACPIFDAKGNDFCEEWFYEHPEEAEKIILKWAEENPPLTNGKKFEEVFGFTLSCLSGDAAEWLNKEYKEK